MTNDSIVNSIGESIGGFLMVVFGIIIFIVVLIVSLSMAAQNKEKTRVKTLQDNLKRAAIKKGTYQEPSPPKPVTAEDIADKKKKNNKELMWVFLVCVVILAFVYLFIPPLTP